MLITTKLVVVFLSVSIIPLFIFALIMYLQIKQHIKKESLAKLDAIASIQKKSPKHAGSKRRKIDHVYKQDAIKGGIGQSQ